MKSTNMSAETIRNIIALVNNGDLRQVHEALAYTSGRTYAARQALCEAIVRRERPVSREVPVRWESQRLNRAAEQVAKDRNGTGCDMYRAAEYAEASEYGCFFDVVFGKQVVRFVGDHGYGELGYSSLESVRKQAAWYETVLRTNAEHKAELAQAQADAERWAAVLAPTSAPNPRYHVRHDVTPETRFEWRLASYKAAQAQERHDALKAAVTPLVKAAYARCGYRTCTAGHTTQVTLGSAHAGASQDKDWTKYKDSNGRYGYPEKVSCHNVRVAETWAADVHERGAAVVGGLLTLSLARAAVEPLIFAATWVEQGRGIDIREVHGFLVDISRLSDAGPVWQHADTVTSARRALSALDREPKSGPRPTRQQLPVEKLDAAGLLRRCRCSGAEVLTLDSAPVEGRVCLPGVRDWAMRRGIADRGQVTTREVAELAVASQDRVGLVAIVLRAAGMRARKAA